MTVETKLRSAMAEAVAPAHADTDLLVAVARRRGMGIRRRRQALGAVGVAAAVAIAVVTPSVVAGDHRTPAPTPMLVGTAPRSFDPTQTAPITGRSNAAALLYAVGLQARGSATDFSGQSDDVSTERLVATYARFSFTPAGSDGAGDVGVNLRWQATPGDAARMRCPASMDECQVTELPDGSVLRTSVLHSVYGDRTGSMLMADLVRPDHLRVMAFASNGLDVMERDEKITRAEPVLTTAELTAVVTQSWWGPRLPAYFTGKGAELKPYDEIGGAAAATP